MFGVRWNWQRILLIISLMITVQCAAPKSGDARLADNRSIAPAPLVSDDVARFMGAIANSRVVDIAVGELAVERSSSANIRDIARRMTSEHNDMLIELRDLAELNNVPLPDQLSGHKQSAIEELARLVDKEFDDKYISIMQSNLERELQAFKSVRSDDATLGDKSVVHYAQNRLPSIEKQLEGVKVLSKKY